MSFKLKIMVKAVNIRLERGEELETVLASYPKLTAEELDQIRQEMLHQPLCVN